MNDIQRVRGWFADGALLHPLKDRPGLVDFSRALYSLIGVPGLDAAGSVRELAAEIGEARHYVLVLIDGLGMNMLERCPDAGLLKKHYRLELRSVFPSTTAAALASLATADYPSRHALTGWFVRLPDYGLTATVLPFVERFSEKPLADFGVAPSGVFRLDSLLPRAAHSPCTITLREIADSVCTRYLSGGTSALGCEGPGEAFALALELSLIHISEPTRPY